MTTIEELKFIIKNANSQSKRIEYLISAGGGNLSHSDKSEIKELAQRFLLNLNQISGIVEKDFSLMLINVPSNDGEIPLMAWMQWSMQWFDSFERQMKSILL